MAKEQNQVLHNALTKLLAVQPTDETDLTSGFFFVVSQATVSLLLHIWIYVLICSYTK